MKFHQIQGIDVCTSCRRPDEAHARLVAAPCIASTAPAVSQTNDTHSWLTHIKPSLCAQAVTGTTPRLDLRPHHAPDQPLAVASRRQRHSTVSHNGGGVTEAMPVASVWLSRALAAGGNKGT